MKPTRKMLVGLVVVALVVAVAAYAVAESNRSIVRGHVSLFGRTPGTGFGGCPTGKACFVTGSVAFVMQGSSLVLQGSVTFTRWPAGPNPTDQSITIIVSGMVLARNAVATLNGFVISDFGTSPSLIDAGDTDDVLITADVNTMSITMTLDTDGSSGGPFTMTFTKGGGGNPANLAIVAIDH